MSDLPEYRDFDGEHERFVEIEREYSIDRRRLAIVGKRDDGAFTFFVHQWDVSDWEYIGEGYWTPVSEGGLYFDLASAKKEAFLNL